MAKLKPRKREAQKCMRCGASQAQARVYADTLNFKGLTIDVQGLQDTVCGTCEHVWTTAQQEDDNLQRMQAAYNARRDEVRERDGLLTGEQIAFVLEQLNLTRARAAVLFGGGPNAFSKYISGEVLQSVPMNQLLRLTLAFGEHAVRYLEQGRNAPLVLNAGGYFVASSVSWSRGQAPERPAGQAPEQLPVASASAETVQRGWAEVA